MKNRPNVYKTETKTKTIIKKKKIEIIKSL